MRPSGRARRLTPCPQRRPDYGIEDYHHRDRGDAPGVKLVRDVTADDPKPREGDVIKETVTIEKKSRSDD